VPEPDAVDHDRGAPALRGGRAGAAPPVGHVPALCLAVRQLGVHAHRRRHIGGVPASDRLGRRSGGEAGRDREPAPGDRAPFRTAEATGQDIIDPAETRPLLCEFVEDAQRILARQLGPSPLPYRP
jgi:hypothetical protein